MPYRITSRFGYCVAGERTILLDLHLNRYFALTASDEVCFHNALGEGGTIDRADPHLAGLMRRGLVEEAAEPETSSRQALCPAIVDDLGHRDGTAPAIWPVLQALFWQMRWAFSLRTTPFGDIVERLRTTGTEKGPPDRDEDLRVKRAAAAFERSSYLLSRHNRCLVRSLAMLSFLRATGISADFVIGVRSEPFFAHSWVQLRGTVLNESAEHARQFTPIMVL